MQENMGGNYGGLSNLGLHHLQALAAHLGAANLAHVRTFLLLSFCPLLSCVCVLRFVGNNLSTLINA